MFAQLKNVVRKIFHPNDYHRDDAVRQFAESLPIGARVLDAGAGSCRYRPLFAHCEYHAADKRPVPADPRYHGAFPENFCGDIESLPRHWFESFDAVICCEVLEHHPEPQYVVRELRRVLKRGGRLLLTAPLTSGVHMAPDHYCSGFSKSWYAHVLEESGLNCISVKPNGGFFWLYGQESQRFNSMLPRPARWATWPWFRVLMPFLCYWLDGLDARKDFSFGMFVIARKP